MLALHRAGLIKYRAAADEKSISARNVTLAVLMFAQYVILAIDANEWDLLERSVSFAGISFYYDKVRKTVSVSFTRMDPTKGKGMLCRFNKTVSACALVGSFAAELTSSLVSENLTQFRANVQAQGESVLKTIQTAAAALPAALPNPADVRTVKIVTKLLNEDIEKVPQLFSAEFLHFLILIQEIDFDGLQTKKIKATHLVARARPLFFSPHESKNPKYALPRRLLRGRTGTPLARLHREVQKIPQWHSICKGR